MADSHQITNVCVASMTALGRFSEHNLIASSRDASGRLDRHDPADDEYDDGTGTGATGTLRAAVPLK